MHHQTRIDKNPMKSIFIDCNDQLAPVWKKVIHPSDPPIVVNRNAFTREDLVRVIDDHDVLLHNALA
jgi:D-3-phosphoglycerate dehydrogenase / 2-oxoglutarate reductase